MEKIWIILISIVLCTRQILAKENFSNDTVCDFVDSRISANILQEFRELYFRTNKTCPYPFVNVDDELNYVFPDLPCGYVCRPPLITENDYVTFKIFSGILGLVIWLFSLGTLLTILLNFPLLNRFITRPVIFLVICNFSVFSTYIIQLLGLGDKVTCNSDGSLAINQPSNHIGCSIGFCIIYFFNMASIFWIPCLCHACFIKAKNIKKTYTQSMHRWEIAYEIIYHCLCWFCPLIFMVVILVQRGLGGENVLGFCYIQTSQGLFYYFRLPTLISVSISIPLLVFTVIRLYFIQMYLKAMMKAAQSTKNCRELRNFLIKVSIFIILSLIHLTIISIFGIKDLDSSDSYLRRLEKHACCEWNSQIYGYEVCKVESEVLYGKRIEHLVFAYLFIVSMFLQHFLLTCWIWRWEFVIHWVLCVRDPCGRSRDGILFQQHYSQYDPSSNNSSRSKGAINFQLKPEFQARCAENPIKCSQDSLEQNNKV